jgi:hypothetical protein
MRLISGDADDFTAAVGHLPSKRIIRRIEEAADRFEDLLGSSSRSFFDRTRERTSSRRLTVDRFKRKARAVRRATDNLFRSDDIRLLLDIGEMQYAPSNQVRFLMAEPTVRRRYHQNRCAGYDDRYIDVEPNMVGEDHYDYRVMHNGHVRHHEDGTFGSRYYPQELRHSDDELDFDVQVDLIMSNQQLKWYMEQEDEDPTSRFNMTL